MLIRRDVVEGYFQVAAAPAQHPPHRADFRSTQGAKCRIREDCIVRLKSGHLLTVTGLKGRIKILDQLFVGIHFSSLLFKR